MVIWEELFAGRCQDCRQLFEKVKKWVEFSFTSNPKLKNKKI